MCLRLLTAISFSTIVSRVVAKGQFSMFDERTQ